MMAFRWPTVAIPAAALIAPLFVVAVVTAQPVVPPIAPAKPAVPRAANAIVITTADLNISVNWARQGLLSDAITYFRLFKDDWDVVDGEVRAQSVELADMIDAAIAQVDDVLGDADVPAPDQAEFYPALQVLQQVVEDANVQLGLIAPAGNALRINPTNLAQSVTWATQANLAKAHDEYSQFRDDWSLIRDPVREQAPSAADMIDVANTQVQAIVADPTRPSPAQSEYLPALQELQQRVADANAQLAEISPSMPSASTAAPDGAADDDPQPDK